MTVNEIKEVKEVVVKTEYIAKDGKVFTNKEDCEKWEKSFNCTLSESMKRIPYVETDGEEVYLPGGNCDDTVWVIRPRDIEDIALINAYTKYIYKHDVNLTHEDIGKLIALNFGWDNDGCYAYKLEEYLEEIKSSYIKFGERVDGMHSKTESEVGENAAH